MPSLSIDLAVLREWWGAHYEINWDCRCRVFRAVSRHCCTVLEDPEPAGLWRRLRAHHVSEALSGDRG